MTALLTLYNIILMMGAPALDLLLKHRLKKGKEDGLRLEERKGLSHIPRPHGRLLWVHAASVGEAQSALILIKAIGQAAPHYKILVTTGTTTSADLMKQRLPANAFHQFAVIDHPQWVENFLNHWQPDLALWMESELWPNTLLAIKNRSIPALLVNARLSDKSYATWSFLRHSAKAILSSFSLILAQTDKDAKRFKNLCARHVVITDNIKFSAAALPFNSHDLNSLKTITKNRPLWVFSNTHAGEEEMACRIHKKLKDDFSKLLTIIVPRHPQRRDAIIKVCEDSGLRYGVRSKGVNFPSNEDEIYIADTMGELGLFYSLCPVAVIGRSFSHDGGGGHNPIEAAKLGCVVLTGPNNQFQRPLYDDMAKDGAVIEVRDEDSLYQEIRKLMLLPDHLHAMKQKTDYFVSRKNHVLDEVMNHVMPFLNLAGQDHAA